jgi:hypothetical protein
LVGSTALNEGVGNPLGKVKRQGCQNEAQGCQITPSGLPSAQDLSRNWQPSRPALNTERASAGVFYLFSLNSERLCYLRPSVSHGFASVLGERTKYTMTARPTCRNEDERSLWLTVFPSGRKDPGPTAILWAHSCHIHPEGCETTSPTSAFRRMTEADASPLFLDRSGPQPYQNSQPTTGRKSSCDWRTG